MTATMEEVKNVIEGIGKAHHEFVRKNNDRIEELEKRGNSDPILDQHVDRIVKDLFNKQAIKKRLEAMETKLNRPAFAMDLKDEDPQTMEHRKAMLMYIRKGEGAMSADEVKLLSSDSDPDGGYWVTSGISSQVVQKVFESSPMRVIATVESISGDALEIPEDINEPSAGWTTEQASRTETTTPEIGVRRIPAHELYAMPKATQTLLDDSRVNVESWLAQKIADKISRMENTAFINGDGVGKPRGILTYPAGTTNPGQVEQINSGNASSLTSDGLRALYYALKSPYVHNARWLVSRSSLESIAKMKDSNGQYLWQPGIQAGEPQTLLGHPIDRMEDMPAVAANSLSIAFGDFRQAYTIVDRMGIRVLRDPFSAKPFVLFYSTKRTGGDVTNFEAFTIQKTAA